MGQRVVLGSGLTSSANGLSIRVAVADPPFMFTVGTEGANGSAWTGTVSIQHSTDTYPYPNNGGGVTNGGVSDADADWVEIGQLTPTNNFLSWENPLYRVRAMTSGITGGNPTVYMLENVKALKPHSAPRGR